MAKIKGKKLSVAQCQMLNANGIKNPKEWLYQGTEYKDAEGYDCPSKNSDVITTHKFIHRTTGQTLAIND